MLADMIQVLNCTDSKSQCTQTSTTPTRLISSVLHVITALDLIPMQTALYLFNTGDSSAR